MLDPKEILRRASEARRLSSPCRLCPRECAVDRNSGERGYCGAEDVPAVAAVLPHFGEEPPICGSGGAGTIFFSRCNLRCVYCQNHQISQGSVGSRTTPHGLAAKILKLQRQGCSTLEPVSPSHHLPALLEALALAAEGGLNLPLVYNTNAYETRDVLDLLDGIVDVYLPDLKYSDSDCARRYSDAEDYVVVARSAIQAMHSQVGNLVLDVTGRAVRGIILRHLVLPNDVAGTLRALEWIRDTLPITVTLSLMAQYSPQHRSSDFPQLSRKLTEQEYDEAITAAWEMGFENVFVQDMTSTDVGIPDFGEEAPFRWD